jgi:hypothetical protein
VCSGPAGVEQSIRHATEVARAIAAELGAAPGEGVR